MPAKPIAIVPLSSSGSDSDSYEPESEEAHAGQDKGPAKEGAEKPAVCGGEAERA